MSEASDQPTRKSDPPPSPTPYEGETHDAPLAPEPGTLSALTHSNSGDPRTTSLPPAGAVEPFSEPPGFVVVRELGSGGMGVVYEARQTRLNRPVALKVLRGGRSNAQDVIRFLREAEAVAAIKHPHVVQVYEFGQHSGGPFMALELLTGGTLSERIRERGRMNPREAAELVVKLAEAVQAAHDLGIVHRDLKPGNVLFDSANVPKVTDFGLAKRGTAELTRTQSLMGTPAYMAPEQARGDSKFVGPLADVWALGAILYECLTGKRAFDADDTWAVLRKVTDEPPLAPRSHVAGLPRDLELIALKCLEKTAADRYPSAAALAADLGNYLAGRPVSVRPAGPVERLTKWTKRNPALAGGVVAVSLALLVGSVVSLAFAMEARKQSKEVEKANGELSRTNNDLTTSQQQLTAANKDLNLLNTTVADTLEKNLKTLGDLMKSQQETAQRTEEAEYRGYLSDIALAHQLWKANDLRGMRAALARCPAVARRWEWHYLDRLSKPEKEVLVADSLPLALAYSPDGKRIAFLTREGTLSVRELLTGRESSFTVDQPTEFKRNLVFHPNGKELAFSVAHRYWTATLDPWKVKELTPKKEDGKPQSMNAILALGYSKEGQLLTGEAPFPGIDKEWLFVIRNAQSGEEVATLDSGVKSPPNVACELGGAAFNPDATLFAASIVDSGIRIVFPGEVDKEPLFKSVVLAWEVKSKKLLGQTEGGSRFGSMVFEAKEGRVVGFASQNNVKAFSPRVSSFNAVGNATELQAVAFNPNNTIMWFGGEDKLLYGYEWGVDPTRFTLRGCSGTIYRIATSPDGKEVAAATGDVLGGAGAVHRFDVAALNADVWRIPLTGKRMSVVNALSPDGTKFSTVDFSFGGENQPEPQFVIRDVGGNSERKITASLPWPQMVFQPDGGLLLLESSSEIKLKESLRFLAADGKQDAGGGEKHELPPPEPGAARSVFAGSPDGRTVVTVSPIRLPAKAGEQQPVGTRLITWDSSTRKQGKTYEVPLADSVPPTVKNANIVPTAATFDATGQKLAVAFMLLWIKDRGGVESRGGILVWDVTTGTEVFRQFTLDRTRPVNHVARAGTRVAR